MCCSYLPHVNTSLNSWKYLKSFSLCHKEKKSMPEKLSCIIVRSIIIIRMNLYIPFLFFQFSSSSLLTRITDDKLRLVCVVVHWRIFDNGKIEYYAMYKWQKNWGKLKKGFSVFGRSKKSIGWIEGLRMEVIERHKRQECLRIK